MTTPLSPAQIGKLQRLLPEVVELIHDIHNDRLMLTCNGGFAQKEVLETEIPYLISLAEAKLTKEQLVELSDRHWFNFNADEGYNSDEFGVYMLNLTSAQRIDGLPEK